MSSTFKSTYSSKKNAGWHVTGFAMKCNALITNFLQVGG